MLGDVVAVLQKRIASGDAAEAHAAVSSVRACTRREKRELIHSPAVNGEARNLRRFNHLGDAGFGLLHQRSGIGNRNALSRLRDIQLNGNRKILPHRELNFLHHVFGESGFLHRDLVAGSGLQ